MKKKLIYTLVVLILAVLPLAAKNITYDEFITEAADLFSSYAGGSEKLSLVSFEGGSESLSDTVIHDLETALINRGCIVLDRENQEKIIEELEFQTSGLVDDSEAISIGHMMGADAIIVGEAKNNVSSLTVELKLIDLETTLVRRINSWDIKYDTTLRNLLSDNTDKVGNQKVTVGVRGGVLLPFSKPHEDMIGTGVNPTVHNSIVISASGFAGYRVTEAFTVQAEVGVSINNEMKISGMDLDTDINLKYSTLEIPLVLSFAVVQNPLRVELYGGAYVSLPITDLDLELVDYHGATGSVKLTSFTLGALGGLKIGKTLGPGELFVDGRFMNDFDSLKIGGIFEYWVSDGETRSKKQVDLTDCKVCVRRGVTITVGYAFTL